MGVPRHIVLRRPHMLDLVIAMCSTLMGIHIQPKLVGLVCVWQIGHARNVYSTFSHLAPANGVVELGRGPVRPLHITQDFAVEQLISHSTIRLCF